MAENSDIFSGLGDFNTREFIEELAIESGCPTIDVFEDVILGALMKKEDGTEITPAATDPFLQPTPEFFDDIGRKRKQPELVAPVVVKSEQDLTVRPPTTASSLPVAPRSSSKAAPTIEPQPHSRPQRNAAKAASSVNADLVSFDASPEEVERINKRQKRLIKNRESAMLSRQRKKAYVDDLERRLELLEQENQELKAKLYTLSCSMPTPSPPLLSATPSPPPGGKAGAGRAAATYKAFALVILFGFFTSAFLPNSFISDSDPARFLATAPISNSQQRGINFGAEHVGRKLLSQDTLLLDGPVSSATLALLAGAEPGQAPVQGPKLNAFFPITSLKM